MSSVTAPGSKSNSALTPGLPHLLKKADPGLDILVIEKDLAGFGASGGVGGALVQLARRRGA